MIRVEKQIETVVHRARDAGRFAAYVWRRMVDDQMIRIAAALSFTSMLALVPLIAIALAMLAAFPVFADAREQLETLILTSFVPHAGEAVHETVTRFVEAAGRLTAVGIIGLIVTAIMLLVTVESAFNRIFRVETPRGVISRLVVYWTALTLGPLLVGVGFTLSGYLANLQEWAGRNLFTGAGALLANITPTLLTGVAFAILYTTVPNRRVRLRDAAVGGLVAALLFIALRYGFLEYVTRVRTYQTIYGALAALPIFLIWLYLSWIVILSGAMMAAVLPEWRRNRAESALDSDPGASLGLALDIIDVLRKSARDGTGTGRDGLLDATGCPEERLRIMMVRLERAGFVARLRNRRWVLVRDLDSVTLNDLIEALGLGLGREASVCERLPETAAQCLNAAIQAERTAMDVPLRKVLE